MVLPKVHLEVMAIGYTLILTQTLTLKWKIQTNYFSSFQLRVSLLSSTKKVFYSAIVEKYELSKQVSNC